MESKYIGGIAQKGGLEQFAELRRGLGGKEGVVFLRGEGDTPMHTMTHSSKLNQNSEKQQN